MNATTGSDRLLRFFGGGWIWCGLAFVAGAFSGCYEPIEGCLDARAVNYEVDADKACSGCCNYPKLRVDFQHKYVKGDQVQNLVFKDSVYYDIVGNPFVINGIRFFFSELHLVRSDGTEVGVEDEIELGVWTANLDTVRTTVEDNFLLVNPAVFGVKDLGDIIASGPFERLRFKIGLSEVPNRTAIPALPATLVDHPLADEEMYWDFNRGYIFNRIELLRDTASGTAPTTLEIGTVPNLVLVDLPIAFEALEGFNIKVTLRIDYRIWFRDVNIKTDSESTLIRKIVANLADSFSIYAIDD